MIVVFGEPYENQKVASRDGKHPWRFIERRFADGNDFRTVALSNPPLPLSGAVVHEGYATRSDAEDQRKALMET